MPGGTPSGRSRALYALDGRHRTCRLSLGLFDRAAEISDGRRLLGFLRANGDREWAADCRLDPDQGSRSYGPDIERPLEKEDPCLTPPPCSRLQLRRESSTSTCLSSVPV